MKIRDSYPSIKLFDANRNNHYSKIALADDYFDLLVNDDGSGKNYGFQIDYKNGAIVVLGEFTKTNTTVTNSATTHTVSATNHL